MGPDDRVAYKDTSSLREDVRRLLRSGRIRYNLRAIKAKGHVEVDKRIIDAVLLHGAYRIDKDHQDTFDRFNALAHYGPKTYKTVFEIEDYPDDYVITVVTAYEVEDNANRER